MSRSFIDLAYIAQTFCLRLSEYFPTAPSANLCTLHTNNWISFVFQAHRLSLSGHITQLEGNACGIYIYKYRMNATRILESSKQVLVNQIYNFVY